MTSYQASLAQARAELPGGTETEIRNYAAKLASNYIRETQNVTSPLDDSGWASKSKAEKNMVMLGLGMFQSDPQKRWTFMFEQYENWKAGRPNKLGQATVAYLGNVTVGAASVGISGYFMMTVLNSLLGLGEPEDEKDLLDKIKSEERTIGTTLTNAVRDAAGIIPYSDQVLSFGYMLAGRLIQLKKQQGEELSAVEEHLLKVSRYQRDAFVNPSLGTIGDSLVDLGNLVGGLLDGDVSKTLESANDISVMFGNPAFIPMKKHFQGERGRGTTLENFMAFGKYYDNEFKMAGLDEAIQENKFGNVKFTDEQKEKLQYLNDFVMLYRQLKNSERKLKREYYGVSKIEDKKVKEELELQLERQLKELYVRYMDGKSGEKIYDRVRNYDIRNKISELQDQKEEEELEEQKEKEEEKEKELEEAK
jgi:hypothetical protein